MRTIIACKFSQLHAVTWFCTLVNSKHAGVFDL